MSPIQQRPIISNAQLAKIMQVETVSGPEILDQGPRETVGYQNDLLQLYWKIEGGIQVYQVIRTFENEEEAQRFQLDPVAQEKQGESSNPYLGFVRDEKPIVEVGLEPISYRNTKTPFLMDCRIYLFRKQNVVHKIFLSNMGQSAKEALWIFQIAQEIQQL